MTIEKRSWLFIVVNNNRSQVFLKDIPLLRVLRDEISLRVYDNSFLKQCRKLSFLTLALVSCSPNLPWVFMTQYAQRKYEPILKYKRNNDKNSTSLACFLAIVWVDLHWDVSLAQVSSTRRRISQQWPGFIVDYMFQCTWNCFAQLYQNLTFALQSICKKQYLQIPQHPIQSKFQ